MACDDRQGGKEKGVTQIEVTPEMIEAGYLELRERMFGEDIRDVVHSVFLAMAVASSNTPSR